MRGAGQPQVRQRASPVGIACPQCGQLLASNASFLFPITALPASSEYNSHRLAGSQSLARHFACRRCAPAIDTTPVGARPASPVAGGHAVRLRRSSLSPRRRVSRRDALRARRRSSTALLVMPEVPHQGLYYAHHYVRRTRRDGLVGGRQIFREGHCRGVLRTPVGHESAGPLPLAASLRILSARCSRRPGRHPAAVRAGSSASAVGGVGGAPCGSTDTSTEPAPSICSSVWCSSGQ